MMPSSPQSLADHLANTPHTLSLSAGFFGFFAHAAFVEQLVARGVRPARLTGSSAGALIAGCYAAGLEPDEILEMLTALRRADFWDPRPGAGLLGGQRMDAFLRARLPVQRFEETRVPVAMAAWDVATRQTVVLDSGDLVLAMRASAAFPALFHPVQIDGRRLLDGGIGDRSAFAPLQGDERVVYHHLASKSPWRRKNSAALQLPNRPGVLSLTLGALPRLGPFRLHEAPRVIEQTRLRTAAVLDAPTSEAARTALEQP